MHFVAELKAAKVLNRHRDWAFVGAANTYNPLGSTITFLSKDDIVDAAIELSGASEGPNSKRSSLPVRLAAGLRVLGATGGSTALAAVDWMARAGESRLVCANGFQRAGRCIC